MAKSGVRSAEIAELADEILAEKNFNFSLKSEQLKVISTLISGQDVFAIFPTGFGKSICYTLVPLILDRLKPDKDHMCVVVSPLKALIRDQMRSLQDHLVLCSDINPETTLPEIENILSGNTSVDFTTPEMAVTPRWRDEYAKLQDKICCVAYDEAHCISE
ncbi:ATP-dependent DNA helicase RecQ-like, partial [Pecten maximus]|uniref:ATP-dependent DNA helicase RecQ-like n=1 Tax=Pecten maximus TaxID=6579 RepID=UPI001458EEAF